MDDLMMHFRDDAIGCLGVDAGSAGSLPFVGTVDAASNTTGSLTRAFSVSKGAGSFPFGASSGSDCALGVVGSMDTASSDDDSGVLGDKFVGNVDTVSSAANHGVLGDKFVGNVDTVSSDDDDSFPLGAANNGVLNARVKFVGNVKVELSFAPGADTAGSLGTRDERLDSICGSFLFVFAGHGPGNGAASGYTRSRVSLFLAWKGIDRPVAWEGIASGHKDRRIHGCNRTSTGTTRVCRVWLDAYLGTACSYVRTADNSTQRSATQPSIMVRTSCRVLSPTRRHS